jgi:hypothetical protein
MDEAVIQLVKHQFNVTADLAEFEEELRTAEPLSSQKAHIQVLVSHIVESENVDLDVRLKAARVLLESSDLFPIFFNLQGGYELLQEIIKEKMRDSVRH